MLYTNVVNEVVWDLQTASLEELSPLYECEACCVLFCCQPITPPPHSMLEQSQISLYRIIPNSDNIGASSSEVAVAAPPWLTSKSEDDESLTHKIEYIHACKMAMEHQRSKRVS